MIDVDVIVPCHNYGRYLGECLQSILDQTLRPASILVVDDASEDNTREVAESFESSGVGYLRVEHRDPVKTRWSGLQAGQSEFVLMLDADNTIPPTFLETAIATVDSPHVGCVYADLERFGESSGTLRTPDVFDRTSLMAQNYIDIGALFRRSALETLDLPDYWDRITGETTPEDYQLVQSLARIGVAFRKNPTPLKYRVHSQSKTVRTRAARLAASYPQTHGIEQQQISLFIPLAGRIWAWEHMRAYLDRQTWPHEQIQLILCDTSQSDAFFQMVRDWMATCDYPHVQHYTQIVARPGLADLPRIDVEREINLAMCRIYNRMRAEVSTDYVWILEDDVIPPDDVLQRLLNNFRPDVASVFAPYPSRFTDNYICWSQGCPGATPANPPTYLQPPQPGEPAVVACEGNGFGCVVLRSGVVRDHLFQVPGNHRYYDPHFYHTLPRHWRRLVDWTCLADHLSPPRKVHNVPVQN